MAAPTEIQNYVCDTATERISIPIISPLSNRVLFSKLRLIGWQSKAKHANTNSFYKRTEAAPKESQAIKSENHFSGAYRLVFQINKKAKSFVRSCIYSNNPRFALFP